MAFCVCVWLFLAVLSALVSASCFREPKKNSWELERTKKKTENN